MKLKALYDFIVKEGIAADLRNKKDILKTLKEAKKAYRQLERRSKKFFDKESFENPYADTRILYGEFHREVHQILVGIDIEVGEILLADSLMQKGQAIDLVIAHHPEGKALAALHDVMGLQTTLLEDLGIGKDIARDFMDKRIHEVARRIHGGNHTRAVDAAKLLDIPFLCCHTPSDNHVARYLQQKLDRAKPKKLKDILDILLKEPEYQDACENKAGPTILLGKPMDAAGKIIVDMTGGTEGSKDLFARLSQVGVTTIIGMHLSEEHYSRVKNEHIHVVIAGHISSDNLGMNLLLDKLERKERFNIIECSGFRRIRRPRMAW